MEKLGLPSVRGIKESMIDYLIGGAGGVVYGLMQNLLGSGLIGGLAATAIAGATLKGVKGEMIGTLMGFQTALSLFGGGAKAESADAGTI